MKKIWNSFSMVLLTVTCSDLLGKSSIDLTLIGRIKYADGLGRLGIGFADTTIDRLTVNHIDISRPDFSDIQEKVVNILSNNERIPGNVSLLYFPVWLENTPSYVPAESLIKIAYSMIETTKLPEEAVKVLNEKFDAVVIPDEWLKEVYIRCGVTKPIFVLPHGIYIEDFLKEPVREHVSKPFRFGCSGYLTERKNVPLLIESFHKEFGDTPDFELVIHARNFHESVKKKITKLLKKISAKNIILIEGCFSESDYRSFMKSLDCYIFISKSEGYSVTPRESLALGVPTILSDNTAHKSICATGFVYSVPSPIIEKAIYPGFTSDDVGCYFGCTQEEVCKAMREVVTSYEEYKKKALLGRMWVERFLWKNVQDKLLSLIKPEMVFLAEENTLEKGYLTTNSEVLYKKYTQLGGAEANK